jgi:hypothetical protein
MKNTRLLLLYFLAACLFQYSCGKRDTGYFSYPLNNVALPPAVVRTDSNELVYFFGVIIDSNSTFTFRLTDLSQAIIDSGGVAITFKSSIVSLQTWYPLPIYTFQDGATVGVEVLNEQPGQVILKDDGSTTPAMDYCFSLSLPK